MRYEVSKKSFRNFLTEIYEICFQKVPKNDDSNRARDSKATDMTSLGKRPVSEKSRCHRLLPAAKNQNYSDYLPTERCLFKC